MAKKVRIQTRLKIDSVEPNIEKAGAGARGSLRTKIVLTGSLHLEDAQKLLGDVHANAMLDACFDSVGGLRTPVFKKLVVTTTIKDATLILGEGELRTELKDSSIDSISLVPQTGKLFTFKANAKTNPKPKQQNTIEFELLDDTVKVIIEGGERVHDHEAQHEMPLDPGAGQGEREEEREEEPAE